MTLERFKEWVEKEFDVDSYASADELIYNVESRMNADGHDMNPNVKQLLMDQFVPYYEPIIRAIRQRQEDAQRAADLLGSGKIPQSLSDEMLERAESPEILGIDFSQFQTTREDVYPPEIKKFVRSQSFFSKIASGFKRLFRWGR